MKLIEILTLCPEGYETYRCDFDTMKDARLWVKQCGLCPKFWDRRAESDDFHKREVATLQLLVDGEIRQDWFPDWAD